MGIRVLELSAVYFGPLEKQSANVNALDLLELLAVLLPEICEYGLYGNVLNLPEV